MNAMTQTPNGRTGADPVLVALDGGTTVTSGIPDLDDMKAINAYAKAPMLVDTLAPAPTPAPSVDPVAAPRSTADDLLDYEPPAPMPRYGA